MQSKVLYDPRQRRAESSASSNQKQYVTVSREYRPRRDSLHNSKRIGLPKEDDSLLGGYSGMRNLISKQDAQRFNEAARNAIRLEEERRKKEERMRKSNLPYGFNTGEGTEDASSYAFAGLGL